MVMIMEIQLLIDSFIKSITSYLQVFGIPFGCFLIILESIIPVLPLGVFVAFNMMAFGNFIGFIMSWICTIIGCLLSFWFFRNIISKKFGDKLNKSPKIKKIINVVKNIKFSNLVLIVALPFSPAFLINIACGLANVDFKKFLVSLLIGKISIIYFWGFISKSLFESITDIKTLITISILLLISYLISKFVNKKLRIE